MLSKGEITFLPSFLLNFVGDMGHFLRWDGLPYLHLDIGAHIRKERDTLAKNHRRVVDRELVNQSRVEILLDNIGSPAMRISLFPATSRARRSALSMPSLTK